MIRSISAKYLKGMEFSRDLKEKTIIVGKNGSGKTAISIAAQLAINGHVPGTGKTNADILDAFGAGDKLMVGIQVNGTTLNRQWVRSKKGTVSQSYLVNTRKGPKDNFIAALAAAGNPKIFDLSAFMGLSDQKKIDSIFELFPPAGDIIALESEITDLKESLNTKRSKLRDSENFVKKTLSARSELSLPSGTLAECTGNIEKFQVELVAARSSIEKATVEQAEIDRKAREAEFEKEQVAKQKERDEAAAKDLAEAADKQKAEIFKGSVDAQNKIKREAAELESKKAAFAREVEETKVTMEAKGSGTATFEPTIQPENFPQLPDGIHEGFNAWKTAGKESIQKILSALQAVNCPICSTGAAIMICKKELALWDGGNE